MMRSKITKRIAAVVSCAAAASCASYAKYEPHVRPPDGYRNGTVTMVEFVRPATVNARCMRRGIKHPFVVACASQDLMTVPNPCEVIDGGWYARMMCHELGRTNGWHD